MWYCVRLGYHSGGRLRKYLLSREGRDFLGDIRIANRGFSRLEVLDGVFQVSRREPKPILHGAKVATLPCDGENGRVDAGDGRPPGAVSASGMSGVRGFTSPLSTSVSQKPTA